MWKNFLACGGVINDNEGILYPPGYPERIIPHVNCQWNLRAGLHYRYVLELEFLHKDHVKN